MELKLRKLILNTPTFNGGTDLFNVGPFVYSDVSNNTTLLLSTPQWTSPNINNPNLSQRQALTSPLQPITSQGMTDITPNGDTSVSSSNNQLGKGFNAQGLISASSTLMSDLTNAYNMAFNQPKADLIVSNTPEANNNVMGINYKRLGDIDEKSYLSSQSSLAITGTLGATANGAMTGGSVGGPWGALVGGVAGLSVGLASSLLGRSKLKKNLAKAKVVRNRINAYNLSGAMSTALLNNYYLEYGSNTGRLYANHGKDLKKPILWK